LLILLPSHEQAMADFKAQWVTDQYLAPRSHATFR
jgi:hypothetical protein